MGKKTKKRRQSHGSAWLWKQTDCWYYTQPGTRKRVALFEFNQKKQAEKKAVDLSKDGKTQHFVQKVKEAIEE